MSFEDLAYEPSAWAPVAEQVAAYERTGGVEGRDWNGGVCIILSTIGVKSGKVRKTPLMRVERDGRYAVVGSMGGAPKHPSWVHNLRANPACRVQDWAVVHDLVAREAEGEEKAEWWALALKSWPAYDSYQEKTDRQIPLFVLEP
jgi:deazaflavin-dependent oxidoreductase (nitroreductase family)